MTTVFPYDGLAGRTIAIPPVEIVDSQRGVGVRAGVVPAHGRVPVSVVGLASIPQGGVSAVFLNISVLSPQSSGDVRAGYDTSTVTSASYMAVTAGVDSAGAIIAPVATDGRIDLYNNTAGSLVLQAEITAYTLGDPVQQRQTDFTDTMAHGLVAGPNSVVFEQSVLPNDLMILANQNPAANQGTSGGAYSVTVVNAAADGFLTVAAPVAGQFRMPVLSFRKGQTVTSSFIAPQANPNVLYNASAMPETIRVNAMALVTATGAAAPESFALSAPAAVTSGTVVAGHASVPISLGSSLPAGAAAALVDVTVSGASAAGSITARPSSSTATQLPFLRYAGAGPVTGFALVPLGPDHRISLANDGPSAAQVEVDLYGFLKRPTATAAPVTGLSAVPSDTGAALRWSVPAGASSVVVSRRRGDAAPTAPLDGYVLPESALTSATDRSLNPGTEYTYVAFARTSNGTMARASTPVHLTTTGAHDPLSDGAAFVASPLPADGVLGHSVGFNSVTGVVSAVGSTLSDIRVDAADTPSGDVFGLEFTPPAGQTFHSGVYPGVVSSPQPGHATGIWWIDGTDRPTEGDIEIRDIAADVTGRLTRLDLLFREAPQTDERYLYGEFRIGEPEPVGYSVSARNLSWFVTPVGASATTAPVWVTNTGPSPLQVGTASVTGDFRIVDDNCVGQVLQARWTCSVTVTAVPTRAGPRSGALVLPVNGHDQRVQLDTLAPPGITDMNLASVDRPDAKYPMMVSGDSNHAVFWVTTQGDYGADLVAISVPAGQRITSGKHAVGDYGNSTMWGLRVIDAYTAPCSGVSGTVDIRQLVLGPGGVPSHADIYVQQRCASGEGFADGTVRYRAEPDTTPPPAISHLTVTRSGPTRTVSWTTPCSSDYGYTTVRAFITPVGLALPQAGYAGYAGSGNANTFAILGSGPVTVVAYPVDASGNIGPTTVATAVPSQQQPPESTCVYIASSRAGAAVYVNALARERGSGSPVAAANRRLYLQRFIAGTWQNMLMRTTDAKGQASVGFIQRATLAYRWVAPATSVADPAVSTSTVH
ncbi:MAG TPA: hypothetical protein VJ851_15285 [Jatrophihabitans sp.]|nr:hypothetical protein [Jatrophihabitans sp.]